MLALEERKKYVDSLSSGCSAVGKKEDDLSSPRGARNREGHPRGASQAVQNRQLTHVTSKMGDLRNVQTGCFGKLSDFIMAGITPVPVLYNKVSSE